MKEEEKMRGSRRYSN